MYWKKCYILPNIQLKLKNSKYHKRFLAQMSLYSQLCSAQAYEYINRIWIKSKIFM